MADLELIKATQILTLSEIFKNSSLLELEEIKRKYEKLAQNFDSTIKLLQELQILTISGGGIKLSASYEEILARLDGTETSKDNLSEYVGGKIFSKKTVYFAQIEKLLEGMEEDGDKYELKPTFDIRAHLSGLRNVLIDLGIVDFDYKNEKYLISKNKLLKYDGGDYFRPMSKKQLEQILNAQDRIGQKAEQMILRFEKQRLGKAPELIDKIEHVSAKNVNAGYDIKSYNDAERKEAIFIEVKAVSARTFEFKWSRNEIYHAQERQDKYFLYLLPVISREEFDLNQLKIIQNPYKNVFLNEGDWFREAETLSLRLKI